MVNKLILSFIALCILSVTASSQNPVVKITDSNTALHLLAPDYPVPYGPVRTEDIIAVLDRVFKYLDASTPARSN